MRFRPDPLLSILVAAALVVLLSLGTWQVRRNGEAQVFLARIAERVDAPALADPDLGAPPAELSWRPVVLHGEYLGEPLLMTGVFDLGEPGYELVQAFRVEGGPTVLVNRGFIPLKRAELAAQPAVHEAAGLLLDIAEFRDDPETPPIAATATAPERWPRNTYAAMAKRAGATAPLLLVAGEALHPGESRSGAVLPATGWHAIPTTRPHLEYAGTWYMIAGTLVVIWAGHAVQRGKRLTESPPGSSSAGR